MSIYKFGCQSTSKESHFESFFFLIENKIEEIDFTQYKILNESGFVIHKNSGLNSDVEIQKVVDFLNSNYTNIHFIGEVKIDERSREILEKIKKLSIQNQ